MVTLASADEEVSFGRVVFDVSAAALALVKGVSLTTRRVRRDADALDSGPMIGGDAATLTIVALTSVRPKEAPRDAAERLARLVGAALRRKYEAEGDVAWVARAVAPSSASVREALGEAGETIAKRSGFDRPLYVASLWALAEAGDGRTAALLEPAVASEGAGGLPVLAVAAMTRGAALRTVLARAAALRQTHLAFAAELARVARGESTGTPLLALAPKVKEEYRIALCRDVFVPLRKGPPLGPGATPAVAVLRGAERHLGRWLVFAEVEQRAGDETARREALERSQGGALGSRGAWALVAWALGGCEAPPSRPGLDLLTRLSDRPSSSRDVTFLFRMAEAKVPSVRPALEAIAKEPADAPPSPSGLRASFFLARDHGREEARVLLREAAGATPSPIGAFAAALLFDLGERDRAREALDPSRLGPDAPPSTLGWAALVAAAPPAGPSIVQERTFRDLTPGK